MPLLCPAAALFAQQHVSMLLSSVCMKALLACKACRGTSQPHAPLTVRCPPSPPLPSPPPSEPQYFVPNPLVYTIRTLQIIHDVAQTIFRATDTFIGGVLFQQVINQQGLPGGALTIFTTSGIGPVVLPGTRSAGALGCTLRPHVQQTTCSALWLAWLISRRPSRRQQQETPLPLRLLRAGIGNATSGGPATALRSDLPATTSATGTTINGPVAYAAKALAGLVSGAQQAIDLALQDAGAAAKDAVSRVDYSYQSVSQALTQLSDLLESNLMQASAQVQHAGADASLQHHDEPCWERA